MRLLAIEILLALAAVFAAAGYIRCAYEYGGRDAMPELLIGFVLALGFLGLLLKCPAHLPTY